MFLGPNSGAGAADFQVIWAKISIRAGRAGPHQGIKAIPIVFSCLLGGKRARGAAYHADRLRTIISKRRYFHIL